jgi:hypothetical protein
MALERAEKAVPGVITAVHNVLTDPALMEEIIAEMVPLYARTYTADEIRQLSAFYQAPLGQKMLRTLPQLSAESMKISNRVMVPRISEDDVANHRKLRHTIDVNMKGCA